MCCCPSDSSIRARMRHMASSGTTPASGIGWRGSGGARSWSRKSSAWWTSASPCSPASLETTGAPTSYLCLPKTLLLIALRRTAVKDLNVQVGQASGRSRFIVLTHLHWKGPRQFCGSGEACEAARDRSVAVFPEHPVQGVKGAVREPPCARQKSVVLSFEAVGWCRPSLLAYLSILSHRFSGRTLCTLLAPNLGRQALQALIKLRLRRRTRTRVVHPCHHVLGSFQWYELGLGKRYSVTKALGHAGEIVNRGLPGLLAMADREVQGMEVGILAHALPALLGHKRGQEEGHRLPVLLRHDRRLGP